MKVAIIHDWIVNYGGAEKVLLEIHKIFPEAPIYTLVYNKKRMGKYFKGIDIRTSLVQKLPFGISKYRYYLPLMPMAFEQFDLSEYDLIISTSSCCAKGVNVNANSTHICYCHTPMRYAWDMYNKYNTGNILKKFIIAKQISKLRIWDCVSSNRVDYFIANSEYVKKRIEKHYRREARVINPPIDEMYYKKGKKTGENGYYLAVSRMVKYKKMDLIVEAFNELNLPLIVVGDGPERNKVKRIAKKNIEFKEEISQKQLKELYDNCKAFVFMAEEDFGMVMAEAEACGKPVIAYYKGGASEIVENEKSGLFVEKQTKESLIEKVKLMEKIYKKFDEDEIREYAKKFNANNFREQIKNAIDEWK